MPANTEKALIDLLQAYHDSVGGAADECLFLYDRLRLGTLASLENQSLAYDLLKIMSGLSPDPRTVSCALLFVATECGEDLPSVCPDVSSAVSDQLDQLLYLIQLESENLPASTRHSAEGLRRMLLALVRDVRVVLIAMAWQLVKLRRSKDGQPEAANLAREAMLIHAPLANRLGVWQLKWELEDLSFRFAQPADYHRIARLVAERRSDREKFIQAFIGKLETSIKDSGISGEVKGRPKHIYSIWRKMQRKGLDFHELFDVRAVRVLVDDLPACYSVLGLVHTLWQPIPGEFDDYITMPKGNNYQSLHTAVIGHEGKVVEVQIRTYEMNEHAELGVASHWRYKEGGPNDPAFDNKIAVMRQLLESGDEESGDDKLDDESLLESFQTVVSEERVYVFTPAGQVVDLSLGSTVLDFAYQIHTEVGHRCQGAKVNGRIVPLTHRLQTGNRVEILTARHPKPSRDWLNPRLGFIRGARARSKVRQWFRRESHEENLLQGKEVVEAELKRLGLLVTDLEDVPERFNFNTINDLYAAVGNGDLTVSQIVHTIERLKVKDVELRLEDLVTRTPKRRRTRTAKESGDVIIEGVGNLMTSMARCCQPVPGDPVCGYITQGRGVTIHRDDCPNALRWMREDNPRLIQVRWRKQVDSGYRVNLLLRAFNRRELIKDISSLMASSDITVTDINSHLDESTEEVNIGLQVTVKDFQHLSDLLHKLNTVPNVFEARRLTEPT